MPAPEIPEPHNNPDRIGRVPHVGTTHDASDTRPQQGAEVRGPSLWRPGSRGRLGRVHHAREAVDRDTRGFEHGIDATSDASAVSHQTPDSHGPTGDPVRIVPTDPEVVAAYRRSQGLSPSVPLRDVPGEPVRPRTSSRERVGYSLLFGGFATGVLALGVAGYGNVQERSVMQNPDIPAVVRAHTVDEITRGQIRDLVIMSASFGVSLTGANRVYGPNGTRRRP